MSQIASDAKISSAMSNLGMTAPLPNLDDSQVLKAILVALGNVTGGGGGISQAAADARYVLQAGGAFTGLTGAGFRDASAAFDVTLAFNSSSSALTEGRALTIDIGNAAHTIALGTTAGTITFPNIAAMTVAGLEVANVFTALQTITQATANAGILASTGYSLTGSNSTSMIDLAGAWNTSGTPTAFKLNVTNTASNAASLLMDLQVGGSSKFKVAASTGTVTAGSFFANGSFDIASTWGVNGATGNQVMYVTATLGWSASNGGWNATADAFMARKAAATIQMGKDAAGVTNQMFTAASRITSDGVGANLTIAGGNGRGGAGGSLIFATYEANTPGLAGTLTTRMTLDAAGGLDFPNGINVSYDAVNGAKWGTTSSQFQAWWGATPIAQPTTAVSAATFNAGSSGIVDDTATWDNYSIGQIVGALRLVGLLA